MINWTKNTLMGAALAGMVAMPVAAQETINAVVIDGYPDRALWVKEFTNFFIPEVDRILAESGNYKMNWQENYGGSIVKPKGVLEGVQLGLGANDKDAGLGLSSWILMQRSGCSTCEIEKGDINVSLTSMPLPPGLAMLPVAVGLLGGLRWRNRKTASS